MRLFKGALELSLSSALSLLPKVLRIGGFALYGYVLLMSIVSTTISTME